ncbi:MAG: hypothetical protein KGV58_01495 [Campylobacteraceae bacterium]|nr:hypothetical protein [Campylobacteraceae bacterium]
MKKIVLIIALLASGVWAKDVKDFDIKGIKLGMSLTQVKNILRKSYPNITLRIDKSKDYYSKVIEYDTKKELLIIQLGYNSQVYSISRVLRTGYLFNDKEIDNTKNKILKKYGKPTVSAISINNSNNAHVYEFCWSNECKKVSNDDNEYWSGNSIITSDSKKAYFLAKISNDFYVASSSSTTGLDFELRDNSLETIQLNAYKNSLKKSMVDRTKNLEF